MQSKGKWDFELQLPTASNVQTIEVNKDVPNGNCTITKIEISQIKSLLLWPNDKGGVERVQVDIH